MRGARHALMRRRFILKGETSLRKIHSEVSGCARLERAGLVRMPTAPIKSAWIIATVCIAAPRERFTTS